MLTSASRYRNNQCRWFGLASCVRFVKWLENDRAAWRLPHMHRVLCRTTQRTTSRQARGSCTLCPLACSASTGRACPTPGTTPSPTTCPRARCLTWWRCCTPRPSTLSTTLWRRCWSTASKLSSQRVRILILCILPSSFCCVTTQPKCNGEMLMWFQVIVVTSVLRASLWCLLGPIVQVMSVYKDWW